MRRSRIAVAVALLCLAACSGKEPATVEVVMDATGTGVALVTYGTSEIGVKQDFSVVLPWSKHLTVKRNNALTLRVRSNNSGLMQCKITINGAVTASNQATGTSAIAACSAHA